MASGQNADLLQEIGDSFRKGLKDDGEAKAKDESAAPAEGGDVSADTSQGG